LENVKMVWGEIIFRVTGYHSSGKLNRIPVVPGTAVETNTLIFLTMLFLLTRAVGAVAQFALDPSLCNIRLQPKEIEDLVASQEGAIGVALISAITQVPCPTISECWKQVLENPESEAYANLRSSLKAHETSIDERNKVRDTNTDFHPRHCAISISS
jgi:hypothetical protein